MQVYVRPLHLPRPTNGLQDRTHTRINIIIYQYNNILVSVYSLISIEYPEREREREKQRETERHN